MRKSTILLPVIFVLVVGLLSSVFIVDEREKALVLQFGRVVSVKEEPGLAFKIPLIQEVVRYDDRILSRDIEPLEITPLDDRRLVVDAFARYRISDVNRFRQAVGAGGITAAESRLDSILRAETREVLGSVSSSDILSSDRAALMLRIRNNAIAAARALGVEIIDVRLKSTDLPSQNLAATFDRMRAEREREATDERARGNEAAQRIRAQADRTVVELVSEAQREAELVEARDGLSATDELDDDAVSLVLVRLAHLDLRERGLERLVRDLTGIPRLERGLGDLGRGRGLLLTQLVGVLGHVLLVVEHGADDVAADVGRGARAPGVREDAVGEERAGHVVGPGEDERAVLLLLQVRALGLRLLEGLLGAAHVTARADRREIFFGQRQ